MVASVRPAHGDDRVGGLEAPKRPGPGPDEGLDRPNERLAQSGPRAGAPA